MSTDTSLQVPWQRADHALYEAKAQGRDRVVSDGIEANDSSAARSIAAPSSAAPSIAASISASSAAITSELHRQRRRPERGRLEN